MRTHTRLSTPWGGLCFHQVEAVFFVAAGLPFYALDAYVVEAIGSSSALEYGRELEARMICSSSVSRVPWSTEGSLEARMICSSSTSRVPWSTEGGLEARMICSSIAFRVPWGMTGLFIGGSIASRVPSGVQRMLEARVPRGLEAVGNSDDFVDIP